MSDYSGTPLIKKLGIKNGFRCLFINQPNNYFELLGTKIETESPPFDFFLKWMRISAELENKSPTSLRHQLISTKEQQLPQKMIFLDPDTGRRSISTSKFLILIRLKIIIYGFRLLAEWV